MPLLRLDGLSLSLDGTALLEDVTFSLDKGERLGLMGESGSGKSLLLRTLLGLLPRGARVKGTVELDGAPMPVVESERAGLRGKRIGAVLHNAASSLDFPVYEPARDALESRPPERARLGIILDLGKMFAAERQQFADWIGGQALAEGLREFADGGVDESTARRGAGFGIDWIERSQAQDMLGVDRIGIAQPVLDFRN